MPVALAPKKAEHGGDNTTTMTTTTRPEPKTGDGTRARQGTGTGTLCFTIHSMIDDAND